MWNFSLIHSQNFRLKIFNTDSIKNPVFEKLLFRKDHQTIASLYSEIDSIKLKLEKFGYLNNKVDSIQKRDSVYTAYFILGKSLKRIKIYYDGKVLTKNNLFRLTGLAINEDFFEVSLDNIDQVLNNIIRYFEEQGLAFTEVKLTEIQQLDNYLSANLIVNTSEKRKIDKIIINGYSNFPKTFLKHYFNLDSNSSFNSKKINEISNATRGLSFVSELKPPEVLFTNDSTYLYLNLKKEKTNIFDGLIGFSRNETNTKLNLNGYLNLELNNVLNSGEKIAFNWKNNGSERQLLDLNLELPYAFKTAFTPALNLNIYKQDSTFINTKLILSIDYALNHRNKIGFIYNFEESDNLLAINLPEIENYKSNYFGVRYDYRVLTNHFLFPEKLNLTFNASTGNRKTVATITPQSKLNLTVNYIWSLNLRNSIYLKNNSAILISKDFLSNELFRIGGINTIRGFNEESIFSTKHSLFNIEYRYLTNQSSYLYSITDLGIIKSTTTSLSQNLYGLGLGYSFQSPLGVIDLSYAFGGYSKNTLNIDNSRLHLKIINRF